MSALYNEGSWFRSTEHSGSMFVVIKPPPPQISSAFDNISTESSIVCLKHLHTTAKQRIKMMTLVLFQILLFQWDLTRIFSVTKKWKQKYCKGYNKHLMSFLLVQVQVTLYQNPDVEKRPKTFKANV